MKKTNSIIKLFSIIFFLFFGISQIQNVYGYDLIYETSKVLDVTTGDYKYLFTTFTKSYEGTAVNWNNVYSKSPAVVRDEVTGKNWFYKSLDTQHLYYSDAPLDAAGYNSTKTFNTKQFELYPKKDETGNAMASLKTNYDSGAELNNVPSSQKIKVLISRNTPKEAPITATDPITSRIAKERDCYLWVANTAQANAYNLRHWNLPEDQKLVFLNNELAHSFTVENKVMYNRFTFTQDQLYQIRDTFGLTTADNNEARFSRNIVTGAKSATINNKDMDTAWKFYGVLGPAWGKTHEITGQSGAYPALKTTVNSYDNIIRFPIEALIGDPDDPPPDTGEGRTVRVRYVKKDQNGREIGYFQDGNSSQTLKRYSGGTSVINNLGATGTYAELYNIGYNGLSVKNLGGVIQDGDKKYEFKGSRKVVDTTTLSEAERKIKNVAFQNESTVDIPIGSQNKVTYSIVEFVYQEKPIPLIDTSLPRPVIDVKPEPGNPGKNESTGESPLDEEDDNESDPNESCSTLYTPTNVKIRTQITSKLYVITELSQTIDTDYVTTIASGSASDTHPYEVCDSYTTETDGQGNSYESCSSSHTEYKGCSWAKKKREIVFTLKFTAKILLESEAENNEEYVDNPYFGDGLNAVLIGDGSPSLRLTGDYGTSSYQKAMAALNKIKTKYHYRQTTSIYMTGCDTHNDLSTDDLMSLSASEIEEIKENHTLTDEVRDKLMTGKYDIDGKSLEFTYHSGSQDVNIDKYNGVRDVIGNSTYREYNIISNKSISDKLNIGTRNVKRVNIFNPVNIGSLKVETKDIVDQTDNGQGTSGTIQKNAEFKLKFNILSSSVYGVNTSRFIKGYYIIANFDIQIDGMQYIAGDRIFVPGNMDEIVGIATSGYDGGDNVSQTQNKLKLIAVAQNEPADEDFQIDIFDDVTFSSTSHDYIDRANITRRTTVCEDSGSSHNPLYPDGSEMTDDAHYYAWLSLTTVNIGRIYDFKITDLTDVNFKNVFRKETVTSVNDLTGVQYYSGTNKFEIYDLSGMNNSLTERKNLDLESGGLYQLPNGNKFQTILPLGPYKHTSTTYVQAPKLGYRISFDFKTSGYFDTATSERTVKVKPSYYYISKDGSKYVGPSSLADINSNNANLRGIKLFYKNSSGKYVPFENSGYTIYFKPNDGYRYNYNLICNDNDLLATKLVPLDISREFTIRNDMMGRNDGKFLQTWYGEFKLPNSVIAVEVNKTTGAYDINKPLTDGYIGVKFQLSSTDKNGITIRYDNNNKTEGKQNTSQWDYEGYMGVTAGQAVNPSIQLEKGTWRISNSLYQAVKGTVLLYDTDNRAAQDFE